MRSRLAHIVVLACVLAAAVVAVSGGAGVAIPDAHAHRDGCHRWHSCPSDTGSYLCGDTGYDSECPGAADDAPAYDESSDDALYGVDDSGSDDGSSDLSLDTGPDPYELGRQAAEGKLVVAQTRLASVKAAAARAEARVRAAERLSRRRHRVADPLERRASDAESAAEDASAAMVRERRAAAARLRRAHAAHGDEVGRWEADRAAGLVLGIALLVVAILVALFGWWRTRVVRWRERGLSARRYAATVAAVTFVVSIFVFGGLSDALGATESENAGGGSAVMVVVLPLLAWLAWRGARPGREAPRWRGWRGSHHYGTAMAAGAVVLALVAVLAARSVTRPAPVEAAAEDVRLAALATGTGDGSPDGDVVALRDEARRLRGRADGAGALAAAADARISTAVGTLRAARTRVAKASKSVRHWERKVEDPDPVYADDASGDDGAASSSACDPSYTGACLDPTAYDYDCAGGDGDGPEYTGTVEVVGDDHYDLDRDGDGVACDE